MTEYAESFVSFVKPQLPKWAGAFRRTLMVLGGVFVLGGVVHVLGYVFPPSSEVNPYAGVFFPLITSFVYVAFVIPYLIAHAVYAILWAVKLRGQKWYVSKGSTSCLILAPLFTMLAASIILGFLYLPSFVL